MLRLVPLVLAVILIAGRAAAQERVLVLSLGDEPPRPGLVDALRIQLRDRAAVEVGPVLERASLDAMVSRAGSALRDSRASLAVWIEEAQVDGETSIVLYLVGRRKGRALVEIARFESTNDPGVDRTLALKVAEVLTAVETKGERAIAARLARPPRDVPIEEEEVRPGALISLGVWGGAGTPPQIGARVDAGGRLEVGAFSIETVGGARFASPLSVSDPRGDIEVTEIAPHGALRAHGKMSFLALGFEIGAGARLVSATGTSPLGRKGQADAVLPFVTLAPEVRFLIASWFEIGGAFGVEILPLRKRYAVNDIPLLDLGRARGFGHIAAIFSTPRLD